ncbi:MAG: hypothetical protein NZ550_03910 [Fimbriimonadales bacterium]|nr:hypothetical protein [Fimbriimonadales bacterium]
MEGEAKQMLRAVKLLIALQIAVLVVGFVLLYRTQLEIVQRLSNLQQEVKHTNQHLSDLKVGLQVLVPTTR